METYLLVMTFIVAAGVLFMVVTVAIWAFENARKGQESLDRIIATTERIAETTSRTERITAEILTRLTPPMSQQ